MSSTSGYICISLDNVFMKCLLKKLFLVLLIKSILTFNVYSDQEDFQEFAESLSDITEDFNKLSPPNLEDTKVIDESIKELNKAVEYVQQNLEAGNADIALKGAAFVNKTLNDITADIPKSYKSSMDNIDMSSLGTEGIKEVTLVTKAIGEKSKKTKAELISNMMDINDAGFSTFEISKNINDLGVKTIQVDFDVKSREEMKNWTKEDWQAAWTGGVLTNNGKEVITDKEVSAKLASLNNQLGLVNEKNQLIKGKEDLRKKTQTQLNTLKDQLDDLNKQKESSFGSIFSNKNKINKQIQEKQKEIKEANTLISKFNEDISSIDKQINNIQSQSATVDKINSDIQNLTTSGNALIEKSNEINNQLQKNNIRMGQLQNGLKTREIITRDAKTNYTSWEHNNFTYSGRKLFDSTLTSISKEKNISVDLTNLNDQQRIDYYNQYQATFDAVELWPQTSGKLRNIDSLKSDGTAAGWINRQQKVLSLEKEYLAQEKGILRNKEEISKMAAENDKISAEFNNIQSQIQQNENLVNIKKNELTAVEVAINKISLDDSRQTKLENLQVEKISEISKIESEVANLNKQTELNKNKLNTALSNINSLQSGIATTNTQLDYLNQQLLTAASKKDLVSAKSRTNINKEMEALNTYGHVFVSDWEAPDNVLDAELEYALKEPGILLSADPYEHAVFDLEKYGNIAGVSAEVINKGKDAILNNDLATQKEVYSQVINEMSKNKNYTFSPMSAAQLDQFVKDEQVSRELVNLVRSNPTGVNFDLNLAPIRWNKGAVAPEALKGDITSEYNKIINSEGYAETLENFEAAENTIKETKDWIDQAQKTMTEQNLWSNKEIRVEYDKKFQEYMNAHTTKRNLSYEVATLRTNAQFQARDAVWEENNKIVEAQVKAVEDLSKMIDTKLSELPTFDKKQADQVKNIVSKLSPNSGRLVIDPSIDGTAAEIKAALADKDGSTLRAYHIANDSMTKSFVYDPFSGSGNLRAVRASYNQDKTNVEIAAEVKSTLDGTYNGDYVNGYMNAKYDRAQLEMEMDISLMSADDRKEFEKGLKEIFSEPNKKAVQKVDQEIKSIQNNIKNVETEKSNFSKNIENLNKEVAQIYKAEEGIKGQISSLKSEITKTAETFKSKEAAITENINQISAIDFQMSQLQSEKSQLETKIASGSKQLEAKLSEVAKVEEQLKNIDSVVSPQTAEIDAKIDQVNKNAESLLQTTASLDKELKALNEEVKELEKAKPALEKQKAALTEKLETLNNTKADLATGQAKNLGLDVNKKTVKSIPKMKDKSIITLKGTQLVQVVNDKMLVKEAGKFKAPVGAYTVNANVFTIDAMKPSELLAQTVATESQVLQTSAYETAKAEREAARVSWNAQIASGASKEELAAAEAKWEAAKQIEITAANTVRGSGITSSSISNMSFASPKELRTTFAKEQAARQAQLDTLVSLRNTPGMNKWDVRSAESAIKNAKQDMKNARIAFESIRAKKSYFNIINVQAKKTAALQASIQSATQSAQGAVVTQQTVSEGTKAAIQAEASAMTKDEKLSSAYASAKTARVEARASWNNAMASGNKAAAAAAEAAFMAAKGVEQAAGQQAAAAAAAASAAAQAVTVEVAQAAQEAAEVASASASVQDATRAAQEATLEALWALEQMPGSTGMHTLEVTAAIRQAQAEMNGNDFNYMGHASYEAAMEAFAAAEAAGKTQTELTNEVEGDADPNRMGQCGEASC